MRRGLSWKGKERAVLVLGNEAATLMTSYRGRIRSGVGTLVDAILAPEPGVVAV